MWFHPGNRPALFIQSGVRLERAGVFNGGGSLSGASTKIAIATVSLSLAVSALSEDALAAGAAYFVDTADVSEPGACQAA